MPRRPPPAAPAVKHRLEPDRPDVTNGTHIVDTGLLQMEFGGLYTRVSADQRSWGSPFTARVGLTEWLEARIGADGSWCRRSISGSRTTGFGNVQIGAKLRLRADPGGIPVLSILPTVNLPTASVDKGLGSGDAGSHRRNPVDGQPISSHAATSTSTHGSRNRSAPDSGKPQCPQHLVSASASVAATDAWNLRTRVFWVSRQDPDAGGDDRDASVGAIYTVNPRLALDGGMQFGLSQAAPGIAAFAGISVVVGDVLGGHGVRARQRTAEKRARAPHR